MVQSLPASPENCSDLILCYYENATKQMQLVRIANVPTNNSLNHNKSHSNRFNQGYERVVFPGQRLLFEALPDALLEVHACAAPHALLAGIPCSRLKVKEIVRSTAEVANITDVSATDLASADLTSADLGSWV